MAVFLMCRPTHYAVRYSINPWMDVRRQPDRARAVKQWEALRRALVEECGATVHLVRSRPGMPDMTFTANAGLVHGRIFIPSRFRHRERAGEAPHFTRWFRRRGYVVRELAEGACFEGAGDALRMGDRLFCGYLHRTDVHTHLVIGEWLGLRFVSLALVDPRFYHLDTCLVPVDDRTAVCWPGAFDRYGLKVIEANVEDLIEVPQNEALRFACNLVPVGRDVIIAAGCPVLTDALGRRGFRPIALDLSEFFKAGGGPRCLTLRLD